MSKTRLGDLRMSIDYDELAKYIDEYLVSPFYSKRSEAIRTLNLEKILKRKNPYLFRAKNILSAGEMAAQILSAHLSSQEETIFGNLMEELAIHICGGVFGGVKPPEKIWRSIDLIFDDGDTRYLVGIKSGPSWGNADQINAMKRNFKAARQLTRDEGWSGEIICVNGVMYGTDNVPFKEDKSDAELSYFKFCGQQFWELVSGDEDLYTKIIFPLGEKARLRDEEFQSLCVKAENRLAKDILDRFVENDEVQWKRMVEYVSKARR